MCVHIVITEVKLQVDSARRGGVLRDVNVVEFLVGWPRRKTFDPCHPPLSPTTIAHRHQLSQSTITVADYHCLLLLLLILAVAH